MQNEDYDSFVTVVTGLAAVNKSWGTWEGQALVLFFDMLSEYPLELVAQAFVNHAKDTVRGTFSPGLPDIIRHCKPANPEISAKDAASNAWVAVEQQLSRYDPVRGNDTDDELANEVVRKMGGWEKLSRTALGDMANRGFQFRDLYKTEHNDVAAEYQQMRIEQQAADRIGSMQSITRLLNVDA